MIWKKNKFLNYFSNVKCIFLNEIYYCLIVYINIFVLIKVEIIRKDYKVFLNCV